MENDAGLFAGQSDEVAAGAVLAVDRGVRTIAAPLAAKQIVKIRADLNRTMLETKRAYVGLIISSSSFLTCKALNEPEPH
jgi:hypothetical protein